MHVFELSPPLVVVTAWAVQGAFLIVLVRSLQPLNLSRADRWFVVSLAVTAFAVLFTTAYHASNLPIVPDSVEAAVGAERLFHLGSFSIAVDGVTHPPRYLPWFSWFMLIPAYSLHSSLGAGVYPILVCSLVAVSAAYILGRSAGGPVSGFFAGLFLLAVPGFSENSKEILTHAPVASISLLLALIYIRRREQRELKLSGAMAAGFLIAFAAALRPLAIWLCVPFLLLWIRRPKMLFGLFLPILAEGVLTLFYQQHVFGDLFRTGYHYWVSDPYDTFSRTFSLEFLRGNASALVVDSGVAFYAIVIMMAFAFRKKLPAPVGELLIFGSFALVPPSLIHLFYFYPSPSFFLPLGAVLSVAAGICLARMILSPLGERNESWRLVLVLVPIVAVGFHLREPGLPWRRLAADNLARLTKSNATIVSAIDPVYLEPFLLRDSQRTLLPVSRRVEYASKGAAARKGENRPAVSTVAVEALDQLEADMRGGRRVYLETKFLKPQEVELFRSRFMFQPLDRAVAALDLKEKE